MGAEFCVMARILVADDEPGMLSFLEKALTYAGHEVVLARDGEEAMKEIGRGVFDLMITDLRMPGPEGLEIIGSVRKLFPELPVIAISGMRFAEEMLSVAKLLGAKATLKKPFSVTELLEAVEKAVGGGSSE